MQAMAFDVEKIPRRTRVLETRLPPFSFQISLCLLLLPLFFQWISNPQTQTEATHVSKNISSNTHQLFHQNLEGKLWIYNNPQSPSILKQTQKPKSSPRRLRRIITKFIPISSYSSTLASITTATSDPNSAVIASTGKRQ